MIAIPNMDKPNCQKCIEDCLNIPLDCYPDEYGENRKGEKIVCPLIDIVSCKDCIHFHYDKPYIIQGIPILGHEVCDFWGDGCKTNPDGFCSYGERRTNE